MTTNGKTGKLLEEVIINVKIRLSALWVALMFFYLYRDVLGFMEPGHVADLITGELAGVQMTQGVLLGSAILMAIPSLMVFLSLALRAKANRWTNIVVGIAHMGDTGRYLFCRRNLGSLYVLRDCRIPADDPDRLACVDVA